MRRLEHRRAVVAKLGKRDDQIANWRMAVFLFGAAIVLAAWFLALSWFWILLPVLAFVVLVVLHERTVRERAIAEHAVHFYEDGMARLDGTWQGRGIPGDDLNPPDHVYARDLDLYGRGSLFELICTARTRAGEETLAAWLNAPAPASTVRERQRAVIELRPQLDLRESLAQAGGIVRAGVRPALLSAWARREPSARLKPAYQFVAALLGALAVAAVGAWIFEYAGPGPLFLVIIAEIIFWRVVKPAILEVTAAVQEPARDLRVLAAIVRLLEEGNFSAPALVRLQERLGNGGVTASAALRRLHNLTEALDAQRNPLFAPVALLLLWPVHFAYALEHWRRRHGAFITDWLAALGEFESLNAFAGYAYERPADVFPEILEDGAQFNGQALGHPLIIDRDNVRNDVQLSTNAGTPQALIVSGSNMSGKSTWLRTIGVNAVLAQAGAPVHARSLRLSPLMVGATLRVEDSIQTGASRFYAEIKRLRQLLLLAEARAVEPAAPPLLFLLDELFAGTNSHDRAVGARAVLRAFLDRGALGLVTTHDLTLTKLAEDRPETVLNVHFEDQLQGEELVFDYRMRPGVVQHSNALALMRAVGLDV